MPKPAINDGWETIESEKFGFYGVGRIARLFS
jgi:hypothetical protein